MPDFLIYITCAVIVGSACAWHLLRRGPEPEALPSAEELAGAAPFNPITESARLMAQDTAKYAVPTEDSRAAWRSFHRNAAFRLWAATVPFSPFGATKTLLTTLWRLYVK